jgi:hypothetical protein
MNMPTLAPAATLAASPTEFIELSRWRRYGDDGALEAVLNARAGSCACIDFPFLADGLARFVADLHNAQARLSGVVALRAPHGEPGLLRLAYGGLGRVTLYGEIDEMSGQARSLRFSFFCDQSFIAPFLAQLEEVARMFAPPR